MRILKPAAKLMQDLAFTAAFTADSTKHLGPGQFLEKKVSKEDREILKTLTSDDIIDTYLFLPKGKK